MFCSVSLTWCQNVLDKNNSLSAKTSVKKVIALHELYHLLVETIFRKGICNLRQMSLFPANQTEVNELGKGERSLT